MESEFFRGENRAGVFAKINLEEFSKLINLINRARILSILSENIYGKKNRLR